jgi:hypothetical protein
LFTLTVDASNAPPQSQKALEPGAAEKNLNRETQSSPSALKASQAFGLKDGTPVLIEFNESVSSETAKVGDQVKLRVMGDVKSHGVVVIPEGGIAMATVTKAKPARRLTRDGEIVLRLDYVQLVDNQKVAVWAFKDYKGGRQHELSPPKLLPMGSRFNPVGLLLAFSKGDESMFDRGVEFFVFIDGNVPLDPEKIGTQKLVKAE